LYLLDTNVVALLDPRRHGIAGDLVPWIRRNGAHLWLSVMTLMEIEAGIFKLRRDGKDKRANEYEALRRAIETDFDDRLINVDAMVALTVARLAEVIRPTVIDLKDLMIAASAKTRGLTVLTRNLRHFEPTGISVLDPIVALPPDAPAGR
jgi:toxin FitB